MTKEDAIDILKKKASKTSELETVQALIKAITALEIFSEQLGEK